MWEKKKRGDCIKFDELSRLVKLFWGQIPGLGKMNDQNKATGRPLLPSTPVSYWLEVSQKQLAVMPLPGASSLYLILMPLPNS